MDRSIDRASPDDLVSLATDVGPAPMQVGAVLLLEHHAGFDTDAAVVAIGERITSVPRLRQVLRPTPMGGGRRIWVDDPDFSLDHHVARRNEHVDHVVVSVPVSARTETTATELGNDVGVIPITIPTTGDPVAQLAEIARLTRAAKQTPRGASNAVIGPLFRLLAALDVFRWFINRQRLVHTFTTNVRGPAEPLTFLGARITDAVGVALTTGNVTVSFAALAYAGTLAITIIADVDTCPDLALVHDALQAELERLGVDEVPPMLGSGAEV